MKDKSISLKKEFDVKPHIDRLYRNRFFIAITTLVFVVLGIVYYFLSERNYLSKAVVLPDTGAARPSGLGGLGGLASIAGFSLNSNTGYMAIPPELYPQIVNGTIFLRRLAETMVEVEGVPEPMPYSKYFLNYYKPPVIAKVKRYTIGLPGVLIDLISEGDNVESEFTTVGMDTEGHDFDRLSREDKAVMANLRYSIKLEVNKQYGYVEVSAKMPEAKLAAQMANQVLILLQEIVHEYKTKKASAELDFLQERYDVKRKEYDSLQNLLAKFRDQNVALSTATGRTELDRLENEFALQAAVLQELAKNLETQELEVSKQSPSFAVIQPVVVPLDPEKESKVLILFASVFLGLLVSIGFIYLKLEFKQFKSFIKNNINS